MRSERCVVRRLEDGGFGILDLVTVERGSDGLFSVVLFLYEC